MQGSKHKKTATAEGKPDENKWRNCLCLQSKSQTLCTALLNHLPDCFAVIAPGKNEINKYYQ